MAQITVIKSMYTKEFSERVNDMLSDGWKVHKLTVVAVGGGSGRTQGGSPSDDDLYTEFVGFLVWTDEENDPPRAHLGD